MDSNEMTGLLIDFYREAKMNDPSDVEAWCRAKGISQADLELEIERWQDRYGTRD